MIKLAVAGYGLIGKRQAKAVHDHPDCHLSAIVEPDVSSIDRASCPVFPDIASVSSDLDGIIIATPTTMHADHAVEAMERGWPVLIEKPIAATLEEAEKISRVSDRTGRPVLVGHHRRHHPAVTALTKTLTSGKIGDPVIASMLWAMRKPDAYFKDNWRSSHDGSPILINAVHDIDLARFVFGEIEEITGVANSGVRDVQRSESAAFSIRFGSGLLLTIAVTDLSPSPWGFEAATGENPHIAATGQDMFFIAGTKGAVNFPSLTVWSGAADWSQSPESTTVPFEAKRPLDLQLQHFIDVINRKSPPLCDAVDGTKTLAATLQMERLARPEQLSPQMDRSGSSESLDRKPDRAVG